MSIKEKEKEITLSHNGYDSIKLKIKKDYEEARKAIKEKLYFQDKDLDKYTLSYLDDDGDENNIDEDEFDSAFQSSEWVLKPIDDEEGDDPEKDKEKIKAELEDFKKKVNKNVKNKQKEINEKVQKIKEDLISRFTKISSEKIAENNKKYEEKIKKLEEIIKSLKEKNKKILEDVKKEYEESIVNILDAAGDFAGKKIEDQLESYNNQFNEALNSKITESTIQMSEINNTIKNNIGELTNDQGKMKEVMEDIKGKFNELYLNVSQKNINIKGLNK